MRKPLIAGNWKMNNDLASARKLASDLVQAFAGVEQVEVAVCPAYVHLHAIAEILKDSPIALGAQDCYWQDNGAYTGEVSASMLADVGCKYVIVGHSERRHTLGEGDELINRKTLKVVESGLSPILCVGETLAERERGVTEQVVTRHITTGLAHIKEEHARRIVIAYEPVWAIGTGVNATPKQANDVHALIRRLLAQKFGPEIASEIRIQYGGSVKPDNIKSLMSQPEIDGALVGGASLKVDSFEKIVKYFQVSTANQL
jgi:triosephosphate isomerase